MTLEKTAHAILAVYLGTGVEGSAPCTCTPHPAVSALEEGGLGGWRSRRTGILLKLGVGCLEEDLDSVKRCDDRLRLNARAVNKW